MELHAACSAKHPDHAFPREFFVRDECSTSGAHRVFDHGRHLDVLSQAGITNGICLHCEEFRFIVAEAESTPAATVRVPPEGRPESCELRADRAGLECAWSRPGPPRRAAGRRRTSECSGLTTQPSPRPACGARTKR